MLIKWDKYEEQTWEATEVTKKYNQVTLLEYAVEKLLIYKTAGIGQKKT